jgi:hypothetical protein
MDHSPSNSGPASQEPSRRRFMKGSVGLGAALVAGAARPTTHPGSSAAPWCPTANVPASRTP